MIVGVLVNEALGAVDGERVVRDEAQTGRFVDSVPALSDRAHLQAVAPTRSLDEGPMLGRVMRVEAKRVLVTLTDEEAVQRATVSALVALHAGDGFLMGIIDTLVCSETSDRVIAHLMPVGAFHPAAGGGGTFRVGAAHQPRIHAGCYLVEGEDLRRLMGCISDDVSPDERLILGRYGDNDGAEAVANGNRMFQRHLAILGNSGAGKSWAVALLLERAARLQNASLIVLDLHGEYGPLADGRDRDSPASRWTSGLCRRGSMT